jgi:hypothetical protein
VDISTAKAILLRAILWQKVHYWLTDNTPTATLDISSLPFIQSNVDNIFMAMDTTISSHSTNDELSKHQQRLRNNLAAWGFNIIPVQSDGDCFFHAVSSGLLQLAHSGNEQAQTVLSDLDTNHKNTDMEKLLLNLRRSVVEEWTGPHSVEYQSFLSATHLFSEAESFRQRGVFSGELGDLVATAMANALQMPIVMFTSLAHFPVATVMPTYKEARTAHPICLAFTQFGAGHYDAVIPKSTCVSSTPEQQSHFSDKQLTESGCTCGRTRKRSGGIKEACTTTEFGYSTRCPCHKAKRACTTQCKCINCANELGKMDLPDAPKKKRKRAQFANQCFSLKGKEGHKFMLEMGESPKMGPWTHLEFLLAASILRETADTGESDINLIDMDQLVATTNGIKTIARALNLKLPMPARSREETIKLFRYCMHKSTEISKVLQ